MPPKGQASHILTPPQLTPAALALLSSHGFPGNIRELKNLIERALIECGGDPIRPEHFRLSRTASSALPQETKALPRAAVGDLSLNLEEAEHALIQRALEQTGGNVAEAARLLGVNRSRIYRRFPQSADA